MVPYRSLWYYYSVAKWIPGFYCAPGMTEAPAIVFLNQCPNPVRDNLLATFAAVLDRPPPQFPTGSLLWRPMRKGMKGIHEIRDRHGRVLYRLFCLLDHDARDYGCAGPVLVMLSGGSKAVGTEMDDDIYEDAKAYRDAYVRSHPRALKH
jgi:hypothetical protein